MFIELKPGEDPGFLKRGRRNGELSLRILIIADGAYLEVVRGGPNPVFLENCLSFAAFYRLIPVSKVKFGLLRGGPGGHGPMAPLNTPLPRIWSRTDSNYSRTGRAGVRWGGGHGWTIF